MALQGWSSGAAAQLITFDDLSAPINYGMADVPNGYAGFNWQGVSYVLPEEVGGAGGVTGTVSAPYVAYAYFEASFYRDTAFNFESAYVTNVWNEGNTHFYGYNGDTLLYSADIWSSPDHTAFAVFNWNNVTKVAIDNGYLATSALDNITISNGTVPAVPEPETYALLMGWSPLPKMASVVPKWRMKIPTDPERRP